MDDETRTIVEAAAVRLSIPADDAELLHLHSNATVALPSAGLVLRIATSPDAFDRVSGSVRVCRWLAERRYPCTVPGNADPWIEAGRVVSVWRLEHIAAAPPVSRAEFGELLRDLHNQPEPPFEVRELHDPFASVTSTLDRATGGLEDDDRKWLTDRIHELGARWRRLLLAVPSGLIHGDAHPGNMMRLETGGLVVGDWDHAAIGLREWDLIQPLYTSRRFGAPDNGDIDQFATAYGLDIRDSDSTGVLIAMREITGLSPYIRSSRTDDYNRAELKYRVVTLRSSDWSARWHTRPSWQEHTGESAADTSRLGHTERKHPNTP